MTESYIWVALLSASTFGMVTVLDKRLASHNMPSLPAFYMGVVISLISYGTIAFVMTGIPENINFFKFLWQGSFRGLLGWRFSHDVLGVQIRKRPPERQQ
ncbi:MAG: hypothetical protein CM1200mP35_01890 [Chloroflexota bacterium]|nr:MAG: hypothetical protein CM1200mP35_01890 [Chloroflexota bacterium]